MKNELPHETSPYLLQHAHNPVHWQPWGKAALQLAKELDKPILVSIGYSACHWCHVMERESFEIEATAAIMNENFINIKIDREERPDIDHIYMDAVQAMTGSGGWPLNVFLTPDGKPFYGGTYFPPVKAFNRPSWTDILLSLSDAWKNRRDEMEVQAEKLIDHLKKSNNLGSIKNSIISEEPIKGITREDCITIKNNLLATADIVEGGFGKAPKFPQTFSINCLLQCAYFFKDEKALAHAELSLIKMLNGGIYDQLGGGLCRYSTDGEWLAPHFEKMLYDNALFITALSNAYLLTKNVIYKKAVENVCDFIFNEMKNKEGGYYAAIDADSEGVEGKFYVWDKNEIENILKSDAAFFNIYFDVSEEGNWEHKNILRILKPLSSVAKEFKIDLGEAEKIISKSKNKLLDERKKRIRPNTDDKILFGWNALLITSFCKAYAVLQDEKYKVAAIDLYNFIEEKYRDKEGNYNHTYKNGIAKYPAFLDDYTYFVDACIHLHEITADQKYLYKAQNITENIFQNFEDHQSPFFFFTTKQQDDVVVRKIEIYDGATPSANSITAQNLIYLSLVFNKREWHQKALAMLDSLKAVIVKHPGSFGIWSSIALNITAGFNEITITGDSKMTAVNNMLLEYLPNKILQPSFNNSNMILSQDKPFLKELSIYLCRNFACSTPLKNINELMGQIQLQSF